MIYLASKVFWLLVQPLSLAFFAILIAVACGWIGWRRAGSLLSALAALILFVTLFTSTGALLLQTLEDRIARAEMPASGPGCIIMLGGGIEAEVIAARGGFEMNQAGDRFIETLRLARLHPDARILVSGGDGSFSGSYAGDAEVSMRFFEAFGVDPGRLIRETDSRTTFENATNTGALLAENDLGPCLLVTSAFHMPRSVGLFRKMGIEVLPWATDYRTSGRAGLSLDFTQPSTNAQLTTTALREWTGLFVYYLTGRTHALFPA